MTETQNNDRGDNISKGFFFASVAICGVTGLAGLVYSVPFELIKVTAMAGSAVGAASGLFNGVLQTEPTSLADVEWKELTQSTCRSALIGFCAPAIPGALVGAAVGAVLGYPVQAACDGLRGLISPKGPA